MGGAQQADPKLAFHKVMADVFESYIGLIWECMREKTMPEDALETYLAALISDAVYPTLSSSIEEWQKARDTKRAQDAAKSQKKRKAQSQDVDTK